MKISIDNLRVFLNGNEVLKDISMEIPAKKMTAIIGPNGSGKSTLLKTIYRYIRDYDGQILIDQKDLKEYKPKDLAKRLSVVTQFYNSGFEFLVKDIVSLGRNVHHKLMEDFGPEDQAIIDSALRSVEIYHMKDRPVSQLSGGERQRVELARAIAQGGDCMVLDEPGNHLDISHQIRLMRVIKTMDITILVALHDIELAAIYFDHIFVLNQGQLVASGSPDQVITSKLIKDVYNVDAHISRDAKTDNINISYYK